MATRIRPVAWLPGVGLGLFGLALLGMECFGLGVMPSALAEERPGEASASEAGSTSRLETEESAKLSRTDVDPVARFVESLNSWPGLDQETREAAAERASSFASDEYTRPLAIQAALAVVDPPFEQALIQALDEPGRAETLLSPWRASENRYLAVHGNLGTARALMGDERYESALPYLQAVIEADPADCLQQPEAFYLAGVARGRLLEVEPAVADLKRYLATEPTPGSQRLRLGAERLLAELDGWEAGSLADVFYRMDDSRRRLRLSDAGDQTLAQQGRIVNVLDELIKQAEQNEAKCAGQCEKPGEKESQSKPGSGRDGQAGGGADDRTPGEVVVKTYRGPESPWSRLRDRDRDPAYSAIKENFPARYGGLLEQYYKSFQDETP